MRTRAFARTLTVVLFMSGCSGDHARKCKVDTLESGDVRISCPGSSPLTVPGGEDGQDQLLECEVLPSRDGRTSEVVCGERLVTLRKCGPGVHGNFLLGEFEPDFIELVANDLNGVTTDLSDRVLRDHCTVVQGLVWVSETLSASDRLALEALTHVDTLRFQGGSGELVLPNLVDAHVELASVANSWDLVRLDRLIAGGITIADEARVGALEVPSFATGGLHFASANLPDRVTLPNLVSGDVFVSQALGLSRLSLPSLSYSSQFVVSENDDLQELQTPSLEFAKYLNIQRNLALEALRFDALLQVESLALDDLESVPELAFPRLETGGQITMSSMASLGQIHLPLLRTLSGEFTLSDLPVLAILELTNASDVAGGLNLLELANDVQAGLSVDLPNLERLGSIDITGSNIRVLRAPELKILDSEDFFILDGNSLAELVIPKLTGSAIRVVSNADATHPKMSIDISQVDLRGSSERFPEGFEIRVILLNGRAVELSMENAKASGTVSIVARGLSGPLKIGPGIEGAVEIRSIALPDGLDLSEATGITSLEMSGIGDQNNRWQGVLSAPLAESVILQNVALEGFIFTVGSNASVLVEGALGQGSIQYVAPLDLNISRNIELTVRSSVNGIPLWQLAEYSSIVLNELEYGTILLDDISAKSLLLDHFVNGSVTARVMNLEELNLARFSGGFLDVVSSKLHPSRIHTNTSPQPNVNGSLESSWSGAPCPPAILSIWPNVDFTATGCIP